jgi:hypothetical protein
LRSIVLFLLFKLGFAIPLLRIFPSRLPKFADFRRDFMRLLAIACLTLHRPDL